MIHSVERDRYIDDAEQERTHEPRRQKSLGGGQQKTEKTYLGNGVLYTRHAVTSACRRTSYNCGNNSLLSPPLANQFFFNVM
jgi:hypothetical protein